jgi:hypothetical protein
VQAIRVTAEPNKTYRAVPLALPTQHRKGEVSADGYRRQAQGAIPRANFNPNPADSVRAIVLSDGKFTALARRPGTLLTFVISGDVTIGEDSSQNYHLQAGDILLTDEHSASVPLEVRNQCRLMQIGVPAGWPGGDGEVQQPGTLIPRPPGRAPKLKRIYKGEDDKAYFSEFPQLFPETLNQWSAPHAIRGFRLLCWEDGFMDLHPCVTNQMSITLAGEMEMGVGGGAGAVETFLAGDVCLAEDRTGEGHSGRFRGVVHVVIMVIETEHLW